MNIVQVLKFLVGESRFNVMRNAGITLDQIMKEVVVEIFVLKPSHLTKEEEFLRKIIKDYKETGVIDTVSLLNTEE